MTSRRSRPGRSGGRSARSRGARLLAVAMGALSAACAGGPAADPSRAQADVELPGIDTREFTPREKREFSRYVSELASPCKAVAVSIAQCVLEKRACPECLPAAEAIAKAVRDGMSREQVEDLYKNRFDTSGVKDIPLDDSPSKGPASAPVTVVEFADFECPFCQRLAPVLDQLWEKRKGAVRFVYKFLPLAMHPHGELAARAAIAAQAQGKFWEMHDRLFANATNLEESDLERYAKAIGLDVDRFRADLRSTETTRR